MPGATPAPYPPTPQQAKQSEQIQNTHTHARPIEGHTAPAPTLARFLLDTGGTRLTISRR